MAWKRYDKVNNLLFLIIKIQKNNNYTIVDAELADVVVFGTVVLDVVTVVDVVVMVVEIVVWGDVIVRLKGMAVVVIFWAVMCIKSTSTIKIFNKIALNIFSLSFEICRSFSLKINLRCFFKLKNDKRFYIVIIKLVLS